MDYLKESKRIFQGYVDNPPKIPQIETAYTVLGEIQAAALIALAEEQHKTNSLLARAVKIAKLYIEEGSLENLDDRTDVPEHSRASVLDNFIEHAREDTQPDPLSPWGDHWDNERHPRPRETYPGPCGDDEEQAIVGLG